MRRGTAGACAGTTGRQRTCTRTTCQRTGTGAAPGPGLRRGHQDHRDRHPVHAVGRRIHRAARATNIQAPDISLAHRGIPVGFDLTCLCIGCDAVVDAVVDENVEYWGRPRANRPCRGSLRGLVRQSCCYCRWPTPASPCIGGKYTGLAFSNLAMP